MRTFTKNAAKAILGTLVAAAASITIASAPAGAHATIQLYGSTPTANGYGQMFVRIPHGCDGGLATDTIKVSIPAGFTGIKPQQKAGWNVTTVKADGVNVSEIIWSGGNLPDNQFDDFGISAKFPSTPGKVYVPVVQLCGDKQAAWINIPAPGQDSHSLKYPAASVTIEAAKGHGHGASHGTGHGAARWTGDVEVMVKHSKATIVADASSIHRGQLATVRVTTKGKTATVTRVRLDKAGDMLVTVPMTKPGSYRIADGSKVEIVVKGETIATTTVKATKGGASH